MRHRKSVVFTMPNGRVIAIEKMEAHVVNDHLIVPPSVYARLGHLFAYWRGLHYPMQSAKSLAGEV